MQDDLDTDDLIRMVGAHLDAVLKKQNMGFALVVFPIQSGELPQDSVKLSSNLNPDALYYVFEALGERLREPDSSRSLKF